MSNNPFTITTFVLLMLLSSTCKTWGCPGHHRAANTLRAQGYTHVETSAWHGWSCGDDLSATGFSAKSVTGQHVRGAVCCGVAKACTVRIYGVEQ